MKYFYNDDGTYYNVSQYSNGSWVISKFAYKGNSKDMFVQLWAKWSEGMEVIYDPLTDKQVERGTNIIKDDFLTLILGCIEK